jgi:hypothetical protein
MQQTKRIDRIAKATLWVSVLAIFLSAATAQAATRGMVGSVGMINPSVAAPFFFGTGPYVLGKKVGPYAPDAGFTTVSVAGTATGTTVGRTVTLAAGKFDFASVAIRNFPAFPGVANLTAVRTLVQPGYTLMENAGALAFCPGPGCTSSGAGTAISWCTPLAEPPGTPAPGTVGNQVGNWDCASWAAGAGGGDRFMRIRISNSSGRNHYGGTFKMLQSLTQDVWRVLVQPGTDGIAEVSRQPRNEVLRPWEHGGENFAYVARTDPKGPRLLANLDADGAVTQTLGCVNTTGDPGGTFMLGTPVAGFGSNCGTPATLPPANQRWGFAMTTGDIEGSDPFPFGLVVTSAAPPGTAFAPNLGTQPASAGFFFTRMGTDQVTGTQRNLVLLGGGVSLDPASGNAAFWLQDLRLTMSVPEPGMAFGLVAGATALVGLAYRRRS